MQSSSVKIDTLFGTKQTLTTKKKQSLGLVFGFQPKNLNQNQKPIFFGFKTKLPKTIPKDQKFKTGLNFQKIRKKRVFRFHF